MSDAAEARRIMDLAHDNADQENHWRSDHQMKRAQLHATLALVAATEKVAEQARIANLIALANSHDSTLVRFGHDALVEHLPVEGWHSPEDVQMHSHIRKGLGL